MEMGWYESWVHRATAKAVRDREKLAERIMRKYGRTVEENDVRSGFTMMVLFGLVALVALFAWLFIKEDVLDVIAIVFGACGVVWFWHYWGQFMSWRRK